MKHIPDPWKFLDEYKGKDFTGEWPTVPELFSITAKRYPDRKCFTTYDPEDFTLTYKNALSVIQKIARYFVSKGLKKGDKIALAGKNSPEWAVGYLSALFAGCIIVPIDYQLKPEAITGLLKTAEVKAMLVDEEKYDLIDSDNKLNLILRISLSKEKPNYILDIDFKGDKTPGMTVENDLAAILFTSGTTGNEKGVMLSHSNLVSDCFLAQGNMNIFHTDIFYALLPLHHSYPMLAIFIESISVGAEIIFAKRIVIPQMLKDLKKGKVTMFLSVPLLFNKIMKALMKGIREKGMGAYMLITALMKFSGFIKKVFKVNPGKKMFKSILSKISMESNRICICGGGPLPASTFKKFNQLGIDFVQGYGLTETTPIVALNPIYHYKEESVGKLVPSVKAEILNPDEDGNGEILLKGPMVMQGYYKDEKATKEVFTDDGYLKTGDVGYIDSEDYLYLTGRAKSLIVTEGGKNVYPEEIEDHFQLYDEIEQILIKGYLTDKEMKSEALEAYIYPTEEFLKETSEEDRKKRFDDIIKEVNRELLPYQRIGRVKILNKAMEMGGTMKIKRYKVK